MKILQNSKFSALEILLVSVNIKMYSQVSKVKVLKKRPLCVLHYNILCYSITVTDELMCKQYLTGHGGANLNYFIYGWVV